jgi:sulfur-oxidizing protein SoxZ
MSKAMIKIKPKKYAVGDSVKVDFIVIHPMETGLRKDKKTGQVIPAKYIDEIKFFYGDDLLTKMVVWESVSTNPYFSINLKVTKAAELKVVYKDNTGELHEKSTKVKPK